MSDELIVERNIIAVLIHSNK